MKVRQVFYYQVLGLMVVTKQKSGYNACTVLHFGKNAIHCSREGFLLSILSFHQIKNTQKNFKCIFMKAYKIFLY